MRNPTKVDADLLTVREAARSKGVSVAAIYKAIEDGRLNAVKVLDRVALRRVDVMKYEPVRYAGRAGAKGRGGRPKGLSMSDETRARISKGQARRWKRIKQNGEI